MSKGATTWYTGGSAVCCAQAQAVRAPLKGEGTLHPL